MHTLNPTYPYIPPISFLYSPTYPYIPPISFLYSPTYPYIPLYHAYTALRRVNLLRRKGPLLALTVVVAPDAPAVQACGFLWGVLGLVGSFLTHATHIRGRITNFLCWVYGPHVVMGSCLRIHFFVILRGSVLMHRAMLIR